MFDSRDYKKPVTSPPYTTPVQSRRPAQRVFDQICPPAPSPYSEEELSYMAAPLTPAEERQERRERQAKRTKNQRSRQWWNHR